MNIGGLRPRKGSKSKGEGDELLRRRVGKPRFVDKRKYSSPSSIKTRQYDDSPKDNSYISRTIAGIVPNIMLNSNEINSKRISILSHIKDNVTRPLDENIRYLYNHGFDVQTQKVFTSWGTKMTAMVFYYATLVSYGIDMSSNPPISRGRYMSIITKMMFNPPKLSDDIKTTRTRRIGGKTEKALILSMLNMEPSFSSSIVSLDSKRYGVDYWSNSSDSLMHSDVHEMIYGSNRPSRTTVLTMVGGTNEFRGRHSMTEVEYYDFLHAASKYFSDKYDDTIDITNISESEIDKYYGMEMGKLLAYVRKDKVTIPAERCKDCEEIEESSASTQSDSDLDMSVSYNLGITVSEFYELINESNNTGIRDRSWSRESSSPAYKYIFVDRYEYDSCDNKVMDSFRKVSFYPHNCDIYKISTGSIYMEFGTGKKLDDFITSCISLQMADCCRFYMSKLTDPADPLHAQYKNKIRNIRRSIENSSLYMIRVKMDPKINVIYSLFSGSSIIFTCGNPDSDPIIMIPSIETLSLICKSGNPAHIGMQAEHIDYVGKRICNSNWNIRMYNGGGTKYTGNAAHYACAYTSLYRIIQNAIIKDTKNFISSLQICHFRNAGSKDQILERFENTIKRTEKRGGED